MPSASQAPAGPVPFWHRLNQFFAFPLQRKPLFYSTVLAVCSMLYGVLFFLPDVLAVLLIEVGILLAASRYGFKVVAMGSRGLQRAEDFPDRLDDEWTALPWKLFGILLVQGIVVGWLQRVSTGLAELAWLAVSFLLPATMILLVQTGSLFASLNPAAAWGVVRIIGWPYGLLCFFLFLLSQGAAIALALLMPLFKGWLLLPLGNWLFIYFGWVMCSLLGYAMYQNHEAFGIDLLPGGGLDDDAPPDRRTPRQIAQEATDALVAQQITDGDLAGALGTAYEDQRLHGDELPAQRRYHRVLALTDKTDTLLLHAQRFIPLLLNAGQTTEALKAFLTCRERDAQFVISDPGHTLALANTAWNGGDAKQAIALLGGFDRRFKGHALVPKAYELVARVLLQGMNRPDMALKVLATLQARHADSPSVAEVQWLLRAHLPQPAAAGGQAPSTP
ncbi:DUF4013 domain-containing protein [Acidovorax sp. SUPP950]|uniref:tetratricopeptide repeat protein n=1 Tax=Acidovorax sp. SUPP950 TaxID=511901 RepID=UPI0023CBF9D9|nr:hypothetical protein [Acidovorax sp. SUPP950]GKS74288.1 DUF4013 domain-containing protein [Acidovorax sp. SUPP950]